MLPDNANLFDRWWEKSVCTGPIPGSIALFVGAGISLNGPTYLPDGATLTIALLKHLLDEDVAEEILSVFSQCQSVMRRSLPRLEHVLDKTCNMVDGENFARSGNPRDLLNIFSDKKPNKNHYAIAEHLLRTKGWCITTNFDDCIERASGFKIPVHVMRADGSGIEILNGGCDDKWGLVKLHGTIGLGVERLGATLKDLQYGLPMALANLLSEIVEGVDVAVVAGYSGTDHFDVNHWIRERSNSRVKPNLIWIRHALKMDDDYDFSEQTEPRESWQRAFAGMKIKSGLTNEILVDLLGCSANGTNISLECEEDAWSLPEKLCSLYTPSEAEKYFNGARLASSIGLGQLAQEQLSLLESRLKKEDAAPSVMPDIYFARGMKKEALDAQLYLEYLKAPGGTHSRARLLRHVGRQEAAVFRFLFMLIRSHSKKKKLPLNESIEVLACALDIVERMQKFSLFRTKLMRMVSSAAINFVWRSPLSGRTELPIALQGKLGTQNVRKLALFSDGSGRNDDVLGKLWSLVDEQCTWPDFYTDKGPLIPGYFLIEKSTAREEDRIADLVEVNLEFAGIMLSAIRRRWPKGIKSVVKDRARSGAGRDDLWRTVYSETVFELLFDATRLATALREHSLQVEISKYWLKAEEILGGVAYWKLRRQYLPSWRPE